MILNATCEIVFEAATSVPTVLMLHPRSGLGQWIMREEYSLNPHVPVAEYMDAFGNLCQRLVVPPGPFVVRSSCTVDVADEIDVEMSAGFVPVQTVPESYLQYLLPSRYCQSDLLNATAVSIVGKAAPGYPQVEAIRAWIKKNVRYQYGTSTASTSALDTVKSRVGVCRDFSHLGMALCRSLNIPARMVVGFMKDLEPMDLHAWFEAYVGGRWYSFDATQERPMGNRITVAYGRDATDVALASTYGLMELKSMAVSVAEVAGVAALRMG